MKKELVILLISLSILLIVSSSYISAQPAQEQLKTFRSAKTVRIAVEQSYGEAKDVNLPFEEVVQSIAKYIGIKRVTSDVKDYDLKIEIKAKGNAHSGNYSPGGTAYSGASLSGSISLKAESVKAYQLSFKSEIEPPVKLHPTAHSLYKSPSDAPFSPCFFSSEEGSFMPMIIGIMMEIYGVDWCLKALTDKDDKFLRTPVSDVLGKTKDPQTVGLLISLLSGPGRQYAAEALADIGDPRAIKPLIDAMMKEDSVYLRTQDYPRALRELTGENFGEDHKKWLNWWKENKDKFLEKK